MNISFEIDKLNQWKDHLELLKNTKSQQPFVLWSVIHYWKHKILIKEELIVKEMKKMPILAI